MNIIKSNLKWNGELKYNNKVEGIVIHHSASSKETTIEQIHFWHLNNNGWMGCGYQYIVNKTGIYEGRPENAVGAHTVGANTKSIGICICGNYENETIDEDQIRLVNELINDIKSRHNIKWIKGHKEFSATSCPGKNINIDNLLNYKLEQPQVQNSRTQQIIKTVYVNASSGLNIREGAGTNFNRTGGYENNIKLDLLEIQGNWGRTEQGWVCLDYTRENETVQTVQVQDSKYSTGTYRVNTAVLNVRTKPTTASDKKSYNQLTPNAQSQILAQCGYRANGLVSGVVCTVSEVNGNWGKIPSGWICLEYCVKI